MLCDWFVDNKLNIHFGEDKTKSVLSCRKCKIKISKPLKFQYNDIKIKQYSKVTYLACILDETFSVESMAIHNINKINSRLRFPYRENRSLTVPLGRLLSNAVIQPLCDYACTICCPNVINKIENALTSCPK